MTYNITANGDLLQMSIYPITMFDSGPYVCEASNSMGTVMTRCHVIVNSKYVKVTQLFLLV